MLYVTLNQNANITVIILTNKSVAYETNVTEPLKLRT